MIDRLVLRGWKSHESSDLKFSSGTNALVGIMGSGKTSVLSAITFSLFGTFPEVQSRKISLDDVIMKRPKEHKKAELELFFRVGKDRYSVKRIIERGKRSTHAEIIKNGVLLDSGIARTNEIIQDALKIDYDLFVRAVYSEQNGLDNFLSLVKGERMRKIDQVLRIDRFESARKTAGTLSNRIRGMMKDKTALISTFSSLGNAAMRDSLKKEMFDMEGKRASFNVLLKDLGLKRKSKEKEVLEIRERMDEADSLERERSSLLGSIKSYEEDMKDLPNTDRMKRDLESLKEIRERETAVYDKMDSELRARQRERDSVYLERDRINKEVEKISSVGGKCPLCEREMDAAHKKKISKEKVDAIKILNKKDLALTDEIENLQKGMKERKSLLAGIESKVRSAEREIDRVSSLVSKKTKIEDQRKKLSVLEKNIKSVKVDKNAYYSLQKELQDVVSMHSESRARLESLESILKEKKSLLNQIDRNFETVEKYRKDLLRLEDVVGDLGKLQKVLEETQVSLREEFVESVNYSMSHIWGHLYPYDDYGGVRLSVVEGDYSLELEYSGEWLSVEGMASGGERTIALLCLRIAFANVLAPHLRWLILDEPTHNLDAQAIEYLSEVLREKITEIVDQVFLITHEERLEEAVTGYLYRLERDKEKNEATRVVELVSPVKV